VNAGVEEANFFLEEELEDAKKGIGYNEVQPSEDLSKVETLFKRPETSNAASGYFLQPIYAQTLKEKVYIPNSAVDEMTSEFLDRLTQKRIMISRLQLKTKEYAMKDVALLCEKCSQEVSLLKTVVY
jgi:hypothetical protein